MSPIVAFAPAKVNLHLHVVGQQQDGYHLLDSVVTFAEVGDVLTVTPSDDLSLSVTGPFATALAFETDNIVLQAARELADRVRVRPSGHIVLEKNLPVAAGLGGGSADAAATMRLMMQHWNLLPDLGDIRAVALRLGADVPVCLVSRTVRLSGIGDKLKMIEPVPDIGVVLVNPGVPVSTAEVFKARTGGFSSQAVFPEKGWKTPQDLIDCLEPTRNDLEAPARKIAPVIGDVLAALAALPGCMMARMSGSGGTCFGIFETAEAARAAAPGIMRGGWWAWGGGVRGYSWLP